MTWQPELAITGWINTLALFSAGLATFALLYCVQPILPVLSQQFDVSIGHKSVMVTALMLAAICTLISATMTSWHGI